MQRMLSLKIWENTDECKQAYDQAAQRYSNILARLRGKDFRCTFIGDLRFDDNCVPEVWLNDNRPFYRGFRLPEDARNVALKHGICRWWSLDELEQFANSEGPILEAAMWDFGYRRSKIATASGWSRLSAQEKKQTCPAITAIWHQKHDLAYMELPQEETERLEKLLVLPNESAGLNRTYSIQANIRGMLFVDLQYNPFSATRTEQLGMLARMANNRGHIAKEQNGFQMETCNIRLAHEEGVYIKAVKQDGTVVECVWPRQIPSERIYDLADDLASRVV